MWYYRTIEQVETEIDGCEREIKLESIMMPVDTMYIQFLEKRIEALKAHKLWLQAGRPKQVVNPEV